MKAKCIVITFIVVFFFRVPSFAQNHTLAKPKTYAVIVGISKYQNEGIDKLQFAHKDAEAFANYLKSNAGGKVSDSNIILLQNEKATYTAIYQALDWLLEVCKEGDLVYFFFSGHGDMENSTIYKLGFLISYNTPRSNYINNAVRIEDLNNYANTLSVKTKAKVILVTDACHSGNLAGSDFKGGFLVGEQLRTVKNNEIRMASCATDQLSAEDKKWGGGNGVFTYYLIDGLKGLADAEKDGTVTVKELSNYLRSSLERDPVLKSRKHVQTPVIKGNEIFSLSKVNSNDLKRGQAMNETIAMPPQMALAPLPKDLSSHFFDLVTSREIEKLFDFIALSRLKPSEIVHAMQKDTLLMNRVIEANLTAPPDNPKYDTSKLSAYARQLKSNPDALKRCQKKLVELISNRGQEIINLYLEGNAEEIERRRYYNSIKNEYGQYAKMFEVAMKLCEANSPLTKILAIKYHYFNAVSLRLGLFTAKDTTGIVDRALAEILDANELEENAAYIHAELGNFHFMKENYAEAERSYRRAIDIAPTWVIPWSAMASLAIENKDYVRASTILAKVDSLQKGYQPGLVLASIVYMQKKNWLLAEELNRKAIYLNSRHYLPFEKLGFVYTATTQYALADSFFYEAEIRKLGYNLRDIRALSPLSEIYAELKPGLIQCILPPKLNENDVMSYLIRGRLCLQKKEESAAEVAFRKVIEIDKSNPLAFHFLGQMKWRQKKWQEAEIYLKYAIQFYLDPVRFQKYCDSITKFLTNYPDNKCVDTAFRKSYYLQLDDYFLLADAYENWEHFSEAEVLYEQAIQIDATYRGSYFKLWQLFEKLHRYEDAEVVLYRYKNLFEDGLQQLNAFYRRVTKALPNSAVWHYRAGNHHYKEASLHADLYKKDVFINAADKLLRGAGEDTLNITIFFEGSDRQFLIKSTGFRCQYGDSIPFPKRKSILYLLKADSLLSINEIDTPIAAILADVNAKIGDMYVALNSTIDAFSYYYKSTQYQGNNASIRLKLIDTWDANFHFQEAMLQLDTLFSNGTINYSKLLLLATYQMHSGKFDSVVSILRHAQKIHPYNMPQHADLLGRYFFLNNQYAEAVSHYTDYLKLLPNDASTMYTLAKLHYSNGNSAMCYEWLKKSIDAGFKCYWVLKYDPLFEKERASSKWLEITSGIHPKPFPDKMDFSKF